jgi:hypothetical protein
MGEEGHVEVDAPGQARVDLTLEVARSANARPIPPLPADAPDLEARMGERYRLANDRVIRRWTAELNGGRTREALQLPDKPGTYVLKAWADGSAGAATLVIQGKLDSLDVNH